MVFTRFQRTFLVVMSCLPFVFGGFLSPNLAAMVRQANSISGPATLVKDIYPGDGGSFTEWQRQSYVNREADTVVFKGALYFPANAYNGPGGLWKSDGTEASTTLVKSFPSTGTYQDRWLPFDLTVVGDTLFFATLKTNDLDAGWTLWKSDGTEAGTVVVTSQFFPFLTHRYSIENLTAVGSTLFFTAFAPNAPRVLWKSDGTAAGTVVVKAIPHNMASNHPFQQMTVMNDKLFFIVSSDSSQSLWISDGTDAGTVELKEVIANGDIITNDRVQMVAGNDILFLIGSDAAHGIELWKSDGTPEGTGLVKDIRPGPESSILEPHTVINGTLFFEATDPVFGREVWKSDGTEAGTVVVRDIHPSTASNSPAPLGLTAVGDTLLFMADDGVHGYELWRSNGTAAGTSLLKEFTPGPEGSLQFPINIAALLDGKRALLSAYTPESGSELWLTDLSSAGTVQL